MLNKISLYAVVLCIVLININTTIAGNQHLKGGQNLGSLPKHEWVNIINQIQESQPDKINTGEKQLLAISDLQQSAYLKASNTNAGDLFGFSVAISGNTLVVTGVEESSNATGVNGDETNNSISDSGAVYVFVKIAGVWSQQAYLKASNPDETDWFGESVAISADTIVVGAILEASDARGINGNELDNSALASGAVYVFVRNDGVWSQQAYLKSSNSEEFDRFGGDVSISGDTILVGARTEDSNATGINGDELDNSASGSGAAYVFVRNDGVWSQQAYLKASNTNEGDTFGEAVEVSGDTIIIGASGEGSNSIGVNGDELDNSASGSGAAYVFIRQDQEWSQQAYLKASNSEGGDRFGDSVSISGDTIVVGAFREDSNATSINGSQNSNFNNDSGAAYVFTRTVNEWTQQAYIKPTNPDDNDFFASNVSISGNIIVIGAGNEDSNARGINGDRLDDSLIDSGAAYVFSRTAQTWSQQAYIKSSNSNLEDRFGSSAAVSGRTVIVGSWQEDSNATGVDGNQSNNSASSAGAAYVFDTGDFAIQDAHSALWFNPDENGHGINVYMLADNRIIVIWYVYDNLGNPMWLLGVGTHDGFTATLDVSIAEGAMFPPNFNPDDVNLTNWGQFELTFSNCDAGLFKWMPVAGNGFTAGETTVVRLNNTLGLSCSETAVKEVVKAKEGLRDPENEINGEGFAMVAGHSALWFNPDENGHGINVYMLADQRVLVIWYVYDDLGMPLWLLGVGTHDGVKATLDVSIANGALFPPNFNADDVNLINWGQFELEFSGCNAGVFKWQPVDGNGFAAGETDIVRLNNTEGLSCSE